MISPISINYLIQSNMKSSKRSISLFRLWLPLGIGAAVISFIASILLGIHINQALVAAVFAGALVFSGFFFRSFGRDKTKYEKS